MKNVKSVLKGLLVGIIVVIGCMVNSQVAKAETISDCNTYNVEIQTISYIDNTITINKDGELYSFYVDKNDLDNYYLSETINVTMNQDNEILDCSVIDNPVVYKNVSIIDKDNDLFYVNVNGNKYSFNCEDDACDWSIGDKCNVIMQDGKILEVRPIPLDGI
jgi:hypothetical protein